MTDGTTIEDVGAQDAPSSKSPTKAGIIGWTAAIAVIACAPASPWILENIKNSTREAPSWAYEDLAILSKTCPALQEDIEEALKDGFLSYAEAKNLGEEAEEMTRSYEAAAPMNQARTELKLKPYPVPPRCSNERPRDDYGASNLLYPSYFL